MAGFKDVMKKIMAYMPREIVSNFKTVIIEKNDTSDRNKTFDGGPGKYKFEFISSQENSFSFVIGKSSKVNESRFDGPPTERKTVSGKNIVKTLVLSGKKYKMSHDDKWLVKVRADTFSSRRENKLDIYCNPISKD